MDKHTASQAPESPLHERLGRLSCCVVHRPAHLRGLSRPCVSMLASPHTWNTATPLASQPEGQGEIPHVKDVLQRGLEKVFTAQSELWACIEATLRS